MSVLKAKDGVGPGAGFWNMVAREASRRINNAMEQERRRRISEELTEISFVCTSSLREILSRRMTRYHSTQSAIARTVLIAWGPLLLLMLSERVRDETQRRLYPEPIDMDAEIASTNGRGLNSNAVGTAKDERRQRHNQSERSQTERQLTVDESFAVDVSMVLAARPAKLSQSEDRIKVMVPRRIWKLLGQVAADHSISRSETVYTLITLSLALQTERFEASVGKL